MKISYAVPVCNELVELQRLLGKLVKHKRKQDEVVILFDSENGTKEVEDFLRAKSVNTPEYQWYSTPLKKDFAQQKNYLSKMCSGDWIFLIDADEYPHDYLFNSLPFIINENPDVEAYWVSRVNTVAGITDAHVTKWGWKLNDSGWVNFPDWQMRIYKNREDICWINPVHERLKGYTKFANLPAEEKFALYHPKGIVRQEKQNAFYETI